jgi:hypothetical protein
VGLGPLFGSGLAGGSIVEVPMQSISMKTAGDTDRSFVSKAFWAAIHRDVPQRLGALARLAAERPDIFAFESSHKIAERCNVSQTSVMRFARHRGFDGFAEMKQVFQKDLREAAQKNMQSITYGYCAPFVVV